MVIIKCYYLPDKMISARPKPRHFCICELEKVCSCANILYNIIDRVYLQEMLMSHSCCPAVTSVSVQPGSNPAGSVLCGSTELCAFSSIPQVCPCRRGTCSSCSISFSLHSNRWISLSLSATIRWYSRALALFTPYSTFIIESIASRMAFSTTRASSSRRCGCKVLFWTKFIFKINLL